uniref:Wsv079-like protein n=1 Tax=Sicyonia whispovirus TaxID=2984283 RepID=A0A9C7C9G9_9VIRU|nr:MAG: wsv079-like protein [Sicyonia whispovirus]
MDLMAASSLELKRQELQTNQVLEEVPGGAVAAAAFWTAINSMAAYVEANTAAERQQRESRQQQLQLEVAGPSSAPPERPWRLQAVDFGRTQGQRRMAAERARERIYSQTLRRLPGGYSTLGEDTAATSGDENFSCYIPSQASEREAETGHDDNPESDACCAFGPSCTTARFGQAEEGGASLGDGNGSGIGIGNDNGDGKGDRDRDEVCMVCLQPRKEFNWIRPDDCKSHTHMTCFLEWRFNTADNRECRPKGCLLCKQYIPCEYVFLEMERLLEKYALAQYRDRVAWKNSRRGPDERFVGEDPPEWSYFVFRTVGPGHVVRLKPLGTSESLKGYLFCSRRRLEHTFRQVRLAEKLSLGSEYFEEMYTLAFTGTYAQKVPPPYYKGALLEWQRPIPARPSSPPGNGHSSIDICEMPGVIDAPPASPARTSPQPEYVDRDSDIELPEIQSPAPSTAQTSPQPEYVDRDSDIELPEVESPAPSTARPPSPPPEYSEEEPDIIDPLSPRSAWSSDNLEYIDSPPTSPARTSPPLVYGDSDDEDLPNLIGSPPTSPGRHSPRPGHGDSDSDIEIIDTPPPSSSADSSQPQRVSIAGPMPRLERLIPRPARRILRGRRTLPQTAERPSAPLEEEVIAPFEPQILRDERVPPSGDDGFSSDDDPLLEGEEAPLTTHAAASGSPESQVSAGAQERRSIRSRRAIGRHRLRYRRLNATDAMLRRNLTNVISFEEQCRTIFGEALGSLKNLLVSQEKSNQVLIRMATARNHLVQAMGYPGQEEFWVREGVRTVGEELKSSRERLKRLERQIVHLAHVSPI